MHGVAQKKKSKSANSTVNYLMYKTRTYLISQSLMRSGLSLVSPQELTGERVSSSPSEPAWCSGEFSTDEILDIFLQ